MKNQRNTRQNKIKSSQSGSLHCGRIKAWS